MTATRHDIHRTITREQPSLDHLIEARVAGYVIDIVGPLNARIDSIRDELVDALMTDPLAFIKLQPNLLTVGNCAELIQIHPETIARYTRLPADHPDHLPRVMDNPIRIIPAEFAEWVKNRRGDCDA